MSIEGIASEGENKSFHHIIRRKVRVFGTWMSYGEYRPWSGRTRKQCLFSRRAEMGFLWWNFKSDCLAAMVVLGNCGGRRHSNLVKVRGEDITIYGGVIRIFMRKNRTDFFNGGSVCTSAERGRVVDVKEFLEAYLRGLGLQEGMLCVHQEL